MRREGRQHGWVQAYDRAVLLDYVDPVPVSDQESKRRVVVGEVAAPATVANGGFVKAPRKPTNHSKFTGGRSYRALSGKAGAAGSSSLSCNKGRRKLRYDELKVYYLEEEADGDAVDGGHDLDEMHDKFVSACGRCDIAACCHSATDQRGFMMSTSSASGFMRAGAAANHLASEMGSGDSYQV